jgi:hypothetical protein
MLKSLAATLLAAMALACATGAHAQTDTATAQTLMQASGLWKQLEGVGPQTRAGFTAALQQRMPSANPAEVDRMAVVAEEAFSAARLRNAAQSVIAKRTRERHVPALLAWYRSPAGSALTRLEEEAASLERDPQVAMQEDSALLASLPARRQALLRQLAVVTRAGEALMTITLNTAVAVEAGLASALPDAPATSAADARQALERQRPQMMGALNAFAAASFARVYASAPDPHLAQYIAFLKSPAGIHFTDVGLRAIDAALVDAATELGRNIPASQGRARI